MSYLFWAHIIFWAALFIYIFSLERKNRSLRRELEALRNSLAKRDEGREKFTWQSRGVR
jgi:CcmD family protein